MCVVDAMLVGLTNKTKNQSLDLLIIMRFIADVPAQPKIAIEVSTVFDEALQFTDGHVAHVAPYLFVCH